MVSLGLLVSANERGRSVGKNRLRKEEGEGSGMVLGDSCISTAKDATSSLIGELENAVLISGAVRLSSDPTW